MRKAIDDLNNNGGGSGQPSGSGIPPIPSKNQTKNATRNILIIAGCALAALALFTFLILK